MRKAVVVKHQAIQDDLIYDFGVHKGYDTEFYLKKGFRVLGLEAVPELYNAAVENISAFGTRATLINKALYHRAGETVSFFTVPNKDDWGSLDRNIAEKGVETAVEIEVQTVDLMTLFETYGTPYYLKCDMEGGDLIMREQLLSCVQRPRFVSIEMNDGNEPDILIKCGYEVGQIVNQWFNPFKTPPKPPREGSFVEAQFTGEMSGLFGRELDPAKWRPLSEIADIYRQWHTLRALDQELAPGWLDLHVCRAAALA
ncbi:FkbM family methyltransferase [Ruegeria sp. HKCCE3926]|uniref:FkbM family methyltransferase n=1 Tax=Ruegeria sp. HKCCE3926 TaxID=2794831 RepID=UPI001AE4C3C5